MKFTSKKQYEEALRNISLYPLPIYELDDREYVPLDDVEKIKEFADDALKLKKKEKI